MNNVVAFFGRKQSGKSSACKLVIGEVMKRAKYIPEYSINKESGNLIIPAMANNGEVITGTYDIDRMDYEFVRWNQFNLWPKVKHFNFADSLKKAVHLWFNIPMEKLNGSDADKEEKTHIPLSVFGMEDEDKRNKYCTIRQLLQGTGEKIRSIDPDAFVNATLKSINGYGSNLSLIGDGRYKNEAEAMRKLGASLIKLERTKDTSDKHSSETGLDEIPNSWFTLRIPAKTGIEKKNTIILDYLEQCHII